MKYATALIVTAALLAGCGIDGEPSAPEPAAKAKTGISITGRAEVGIRKQG